MINKDKLNKMYDIVIGGYKITNDNLNSCGFDIYDIDKLIENGVLKKAQKDIYEFLSINDLLLYSKELSIQKNYKKALNMNEEYLKKENKKIDKNIIHILLLEITKMIEKNPKESNQNYVIDNIESLVSLVLSGTLIEEVCIKFNLNEEQKCIILLMCAKNLYLQGNILSGDQYLKQAEKIKSKSKKVKDQLEEIKTNREFYKNIIKEDYKPLVLK